MATSSILENIRVNNPKAVEEFVAAMEASAQKPIREMEVKRSAVVTDPDRLKSVVMKGLKNRGQKK